MPTKTLTGVRQRGGAVWTVVVLGVVMALTAATGAWAQEPGVHIDPGSPTGKEDAVPLSQARGEATPPRTQHGSTRHPAGGGSSSSGSSSGGSSAGSASSGSSSASDVPFGQGVGTAGSGQR